MAKLKDLLSEVFDETPKVNKHKVIEGVKSYGNVGKSLYNNSNIMKVAEELSKIAESAHHHILGEEADWFDKVSVSRNMKTLKGSVVEFQKTAKEANSLNQRLTSLYEDIGHVLNRYYEIDEIIEDAGDMDNDGVDEPDDKEYMDNKDKAIKKAVSQESIGNEDGLAPDSPDKDGDEMKEALDGDKAPDGGGDEEDLAARDGDDMTEIKRSLKDVGGVVSIPALGDFIKRK